MRHRYIALALLFSTVGSAGARAQNRNTDGLVPADYARVSFAAVQPVNPSGSLKQWKAGNGVNFMWENWSAGGRGGGVGLVGFGLYADLALLPFDESAFIQDFSTGPNGVVLSASAGRARALQIGVNTRVRIPVPYLTPSVSVGFGFIDWRPPTIDYVATLGSGSAKQQNRQGGVVTLAGALDKHIYGRFAVFGEAAYSYGFTSFGQGLAASGSACVAANCDLLKNTQFGSIRGGLRIRANR